MNEWDDEERDDIVALQLKNAYDDDVDDSVPDSWDAETTTQTEPKTAPGPVKLSLAERIKMKEEQKRKKKEEWLQKEEELKQFQPVTELQRQKVAEEAELGLLQDTFGPSTVSVQNVKDSIDSFNPTTKEDFNKLNELLCTKLTNISKSPHYSSFADKLIRDSVIHMDIDSLRSVSATLNALITEKQKLAKQAKSKKKGKKLMVERENDYNYEVDENLDVADDYEDFM